MGIAGPSLSLNLVEKIGKSFSTRFNQLMLSGLREAKPFLVLYNGVVSISSLYIFNCVHLVTHLSKLIINYLFYQNQVNF